MYKILPFKLSNRLTLLTITVCLVLATMAGVSLYGSSPAQEQPATKATPENAALTVTTYKLTPVELTRTVSVNGSIHAWQEVVISPEVGGYRVAEVYVDVGDQVSKGQKLVQLSTALLEAEVSTRQATLKQREAELLNARAALKRGQTLSARSLISEADLDSLKSEELGAQARVEGAQADLDTSRLRLQFANVTAPDDGVITSRSINVGQLAQAGGEMLRLLRNGRVEWRGEVPEARFSELRPGLPVQISTADGASFTGTVRTVAPTIVSATRTGLVYVDINADGRIRPGMFARGEIEIGRSPSFTAPMESVINSDGYSYVFILRGDQTVERRRIETGIVQANFIEITRGVETGEVLVKDGAGFLKDGDIVGVAAAD
ncbi:MAG: HlyD D23 protein [Gammaproteobacteria bacterium]|nr:HlyD D23 protein [Gammaproteobacteria bacterium]